MTAKHIEVFYFEGCSSWKRALENLEVAEQREVARLKQRLTVFVETLGRPDVKGGPKLDHGGGGK